MPSIKGFTMDVIKKWKLFINIFTILGVIFCVGLISLIATRGSILKSRIRKDTTFKIKYSWDQSDSEANITFEIRPVMGDENGVFVLDWSEGQINLSKDECASLKHAVMKGGFFSPTSYSANRSTKRAKKVLWIKETCRNGKWSSNRVLIDHEISLFETYLRSLSKDILPTYSGFSDTAH